MRIAIISTSGTSLLTNGAAEDTRRILRDTANLRRDQYDAQSIAVVEARIETVRAGLEAAPPQMARDMSAEINGYLGAVGSGSSEIHFLLHTDTYQGAAAARLAAEWLQAHCGGMHYAQVLQGFSTASQLAFAEGIDSLLHWCDMTLPDLRQQHSRIVFNLVGGFKSLQAYAQTIAMVYGAEMVYVFETPGSPLLRIPRLPVALDTAALERHRAIVARMATARENVSVADVADLPGAYLTVMGDIAALSEWGKLAWNASKRQLLSGDLISQPGVVYDRSFQQDYKRLPAGSEERLALQEAVAVAAYLWKGGGLAALRGHGGLLYEDYEHGAGIGHFRVNLNLRVSCRPEGDRLRLRHFGPHDYVNDNP